MRVERSIVLAVLMIASSAASTEVVEEAVTRTRPLLQVDHGARTLSFAAGDKTGGVAVALTRTDAGAALVALPLDTALEPLADPVVLVPPQPVPMVQLAAARTTAGRLLVAYPRPAAAGVDLVLGAWDDGLALLSPPQAIASGLLADPSPAIAVVGDRALLVFQGSAPSGDGWPLRGVWTDLEGAPLAPAFNLSEISHTHLEPAVAAHDDRALVVWRTREGLVARLASPERRSPVQTIGTAVAGAHAVVATAAGFVVVWIEKAGDVVRLRGRTVGRDGQLDVIRDLGGNVAPAIAAAGGRQSLALVNSHGGVWVAFLGRLEGALQPVPHLVRIGGEGGEVELRQLPDNGEGGRIGLVGLVARGGEGAGLLWLRAGVLNASTVESVR